MYIITKNSKYEVRLDDNQFAITKVAAFKKGYGYYKVGETFFVKRLSIAVGEPAYFDDVKTSTVLGIMESIEIDEYAQQRPRKPQELINP